MFDFLEMAHTKCFSSIRTRKTAYSPSNSTNSNKKSPSSKVQVTEPRHGLPCQEALGHLRYGLAAHRRPVPCRGWTDRDSFLADYKCDATLQCHYGAAWVYNWAAILRPSGVPAPRGWWSQMQFQCGAVIPHNCNKLSTLRARCAGATCCSEI